MTTTIADDKAAEPREHIEEAIAPYRASTTKPPFSEEQMVAMALVVAEGELAPYAIYKWVTDNFRYHRDMVIRGFWREQHQHNKSMRGSFQTEASDFQAAIHEVLDTFEIPLLKGSSDGIRYFHISVVAAQLLLTPSVVAAGSKVSTSSPPC
jgi:hypothetical protein